jgi:glycosyltransferase involved in cell wall biosynthesis
MSRKKYLFMIYDMNVGGAEVGLVDVMNELVRDNHVDLVLLRMRGPLLSKLDPDIRVFSIMKGEKNTLYNIFIRFCFFTGGLFTRHAYKKTIKDAYDVEVAYLEGYPTIFIASSPNRQSVKIASVRVGLKRHTMTINKLFYGKRLLEKAYAKMDAIHCVSAQTKQEFIESFPAFKDKTHVLYTYFDVGSIREKAGHESSPFCDSIFNYLVVGRFAPQKGYDRLIRAFAQIHRLHPRTSLHILGEDNTENGSQIKELIQQLGLTDSVHIHGVVQNPYPYMKHCDALVSSSLYEGFPRVVNEALALGKLVIGTDVTGTREALQQGSLGILVKDSVNGLVEGMMMAFENPEIKEQYAALLSKYDGNKKHFFDGFTQLTHKKESLAVFMPRMTIGGMERALVNLLKNQQLQRLYHTTLYCGYGGQPNLLDQLPDGITIELLCKGPWHILGKLAAAMKLAWLLVFTPSYDVSICYSHHIPVLAKLARKASRRSTLFVHNNIIHSHGKEKAQALINKLKVHEFDQIVCVSQDGKSVVEKLSGRKDIYVINNLIDGEDMLRKAEEPVQDYSFTERIVFVHVSRHEEKSKALSRLFQACQRLNVEGFEYDLLLVGDGPDHAAYLHDIQQKRLDNVIVLGKKSNPYPYMKRASALVLCSRYEGYPVVFLEAMLLGLPIITTDVSDARTEVEGKYGIVVDNTDEAIYDGMKQFLLHGFTIDQPLDYRRFNEDISKRIHDVIKKKRSCDT